MNKTTQHNVVFGCYGN